jgi:hypothetical protein
LAKSTCSRDDCNEPRHAYGYCSTHAARFRKNGHTELLPRKSFEELFWEKVDKNGPVPDHLPELGQCWLWTASKCKINGYGRVTYRGIRGTNAQRAAYELAYGVEIPPGMLACHRCDVRLCCRPDHLFVGSKGDNNRDRARKGRSRKQRGMDSFNAKLSDDDVRNIRGLVAAGATQASVARRYGIRSGHCSAIVNRRLWTHVA